jgi:hypothetical protein
MSHKKWFRFRRTVSDDGDIEETALTPANHNPWYCLATLHGEQPVDHFDHQLHEKNRVDWERWITGAANDPEQRNELAANFGRRASSSKSLTLPEPGTPVDFSHTRFDGRVHLAGFRFPVPADFHSATFSADASFTAAQFNRIADFSSATFSGDTKFDRAHFDVGGDFQSATFAKRADFEYVSNFVNANFRSATFSDYADFNNVSFNGDRPDFFLARFSSDVDFASAKFNGGVDFGSATFSKTASFNAATFNMANFNAATFFNPVTFINAKFNGSASFAFARFDAQPPDFRGATMHEATEWHGVTWPKPPKTKANAQQQVYVYERLKQEMERLKKHEDEQKFFRRELRARRRLLWASPGDWLLNFLYERSSDYGLSVIRPLFWLFFVFAAGTAFFAGYPLYCGAPMPITLAAELSGANILVFLPNKREIMMDTKVVDCLSNTATVAISTAQSLLGVVLLFLLGLALRNRFRMR